MTTDEEIRDFAETLSADSLPRERSYEVKAARPQRSPETVAGPISGLYHAMYVRDRLQDEMGYAGVSFFLDEVDD